MSQSSSSSSSSSVDDIEEEQPTHPLLVEVANALNSVDEICQRFDDTSDPSELNTLLMLFERLVGITKSNIENPAINNAQIRSAQTKKRKGDNEDATS
jgi:uncharacterized protein YmfQ (DUF2313 family)